MNLPISSNSSAQVYNSSAPVYSLAQGYDPQNLISRIQEYALSNFDHLEEIITGFQNQALGLCFKQFDATNISLKKFHDCTHKHLFDLEQWTQEPVFGLYSKIFSCLYVSKLTNEISKLYYLYLSYSMQQDFLEQNYAGQLRNIASEVYKKHDFNDKQEKVIDQVINVFFQLLREEKLETSKQFERFSEKSYENFNHQDTETMDLNAILEETAIQMKRSKFSEEVKKVIGRAGRKVFIPKKELFENINFNTTSPIQQQLYKNSGLELMVGAQKNVFTRYMQQSSHHVALCVGDFAKGLL